VGASEVDVVTQGEEEVRLGKARGLDGIADVLLSGGASAKVTDGDKADRLGAVGSGRGRKVERASKLDLALAGHVSKEVVAIGRLGRQAGDLTRSLGCEHRTTRAAAYLGAEKVELDKAGLDGDVGGLRVDVDGTTVGERDLDGRDSDVQRRAKDDDRRRLGRGQQVLAG